MQTGEIRFITVPHKGFLWFLDPLNVRSNFPLINRIYPSKGNITSDFHRHYSKEELTGLLAKAGFRVERVNYSGISPVEPFFIILWSASRRSRLVKRVYDATERIRMGLAQKNFGTFSYNIAIKAKKTGKPIIR